MPRRPRIEFPGAHYHVMCRGDRREDIFLGNDDRERFLETLSEACERTGWKIHAWVLMSNHYHWLLETPEANLAEGMKWFQNTYTRRFNSRNKVWGHVFGGRYKSIVVGEGIYYRTLVDYIHLNPVRAALVQTKRPEDIMSYKWSSLPEGYMQLPSKRPPWLLTHHRLGIEPAKEVVKHRKAYLYHLHRIAIEEGRQAGKRMPDGQGGQSTLTRGWYWGTQEFRESLEKIIKKANKGRAPGSGGMTRKNVLPKHDIEEAERILEDGMKAFGLSRKEIQATKGSHPPKVVIASAIHARTTASQQWIADKLSMRSAVNVSQQIGRLKKGEIRVGKAEKLWLDSVNISS